MARSWWYFGVYRGAFLSSGALGSCSSSLDADFTKGLLCSCLSIVRPLALVLSMRRPHENWMPGGLSSWPGSQRRCRSQLKTLLVSLRWLSSLTGRSPAGSQLGSGPVPLDCLDQQAGCCMFNDKLRDHKSLWFGHLYTSFSTQRRYFGEVSP